MKSYLYFLLCSLYPLLTTTAPAPQIPDEPEPDVPGQNPWEFQIAHCTDTQTSILQSIFQGFPGEFSSIISEVGQGVASPYGFSAFFKTDASIPRVLNLFQRIANKDRLNTGVLRYSIIFNCVNPGEPLLATKLAYAQQNPDVPAASDSRTNDIFIFPLFWTLIRTPGRCPAVQDNHAVLNDGNLVTSQWGTIVHELADKYLHFGETRAQAAMWPEVYNIQDCIDLPVERQVMNAQNFAMFACGEPPLPNPFVLLFVVS